jgi:1,2-phenylacetyl-CoA epoxidase catalytic subunit
MNDLVILGIVLAGMMAGLFIWQHFEHKKSAQELKMFQMENTRLIQEWRKDTVAHLKTMGLRVEQIYEILGKADGS